MPAPGSRCSCLEFLPKASYQFPEQPGVGERGSGTLGAVLGKAGMPSWSPTWGGAGGGGRRCWAGRAQLSHSSGSQKALQGALSLFRQEMSADSGLWDAIAGWLIGLRSRVRQGLGARPEPTQWVLWGRQSHQTQIPRLGSSTPREKNHSLSNNKNSSYHLWGTYYVQGTMVGLVSKAPGD